MILYIHPLGKPLRYLVGHPKSWNFSYFSEGLGWNPTNQIRSFFRYWFINFSNYSYRCHKPYSYCSYVHRLTSRLACDTVCGRCATCQSKNLGELGSVPRRLPADVRSLGQGPFFGHSRDNLSLKPWFMYGISGWYMGYIYIYIYIYIYTYMYMCIYIYINLYYLGKL